MKIACDIKALRGALALAGRIVPAKGTIPILLHVRIVTNDDRITVAGTNMDTSFEADLPAQVMEEGEAALPLAALAAFVMAAKADALTLEADRRGATIRAGRARITLAPADPADFPRMAQPAGELVAVDADTFSRALRFCAAACAPDGETRYYLRGIWAEEREGESVTLWGSDGHRLHRADLPGVPTLGGGGILPAHAVPTILGALEKDEGPRILVTPNAWAAQGVGVRLCGRMIEATYPDIRRAMERHQDWTEVIAAPREELTSAIALAGCGAETMSGKARAIVIRADAGTPAVLRGVRGAAGVVHAGRAETETPARGEARALVASPYLADALAGIGAADVLLECSGGDGNAVLRITPAQASATIGLTAIVMGMRASEAELADA